MIADEIKLKPEKPKPEVRTGWFLLDPPALTNAPLLYISRDTYWMSWDSDNTVTWSASQDATEWTEVDCGCDLAETNPPHCHENVNNP